MTEAELYTLYKGVYLPTHVHSPQSLKYFEEFTFRPDDIVIVTYPKSGTTWMQEIVPQIISGGDPASVETLHNWDRVPWLEEQRACMLNVEQRPSPRMFTSHFHYNMMPPSFFDVKPKVNVPYPYVLLPFDISASDQTMFTVSEYTTGVGLLCHCVVFL
uniref:Sulfotransferase n=1 Tax=Monopterus albus TaxID=43700 RepID=A0A3Q3JRJ4_MONAL